MKSLATLKLPSILQFTIFYMCLAHILCASNFTGALNITTQTSNISTQQPSNMTTNMTTQTNKMTGGVIKTTLSPAYEARLIIEAAIYREYISRGISVLFCLVAYILLHTLKLTASIKFFIHRNLLLSTLISNCLFFIYHDDLVYVIMPIRELCTSLSILDIYIQTTVFTWMLSEGISICLKLFTVFNTMSYTKERLLFLFIGWGIPALIQGVLVSIFFKPINTVKFCGIIPDEVYFDNHGVQHTRYYSWIYKGPVATMLVANFACFVLILAIVIRSACDKKRQNSKVKSLMITIRSMAMIFPLLGITFLLSFFMDNTHVLNLASVLNGALGVAFFIFHVLLDPQVRAAFIKQTCSKEMARKILKINETSTSTATVYQRKQKSPTTLQTKSDHSQNEKTSKSSDTSTPRPVRQTVKFSDNYEKISDVSCDGGDNKHLGVFCEHVYDGDSLSDTTIYEGDNSGSQNRLEETHYGIDDISITIEQYYDGDNKTNELHHVYDGERIIENSDFSEVEHGLCNEAYYQTECQENTEL